MAMATTVHNSVDMWKKETGTHASTGRYGSPPFSEGCKPGTHRRIPCAAGSLVSAALRRSVSTHAVPPDLADRAFAELLGVHPSISPVSWSIFIVQLQLSRFFYPSV